MHPSLIYEGTEGFDHKFFEAGNWGVAMYFAENANCCNDYAY
jgi:hypothetical protein